MADLTGLCTTEEVGSRPGTRFVASIRERTSPRLSASRPAVSASTLRTASSNDRHSRRISDSSSGGLISRRYPSRLHLLVQSTAGFRGGIAETGDEIRFPVRGGGGIWLAAAVTIMPSNGAASCQP